MTIRKTLVTPISAGIFMHNCPMPPTRINSILYTISKRTSDNNLIEGNIIKGFGFGIFALGMGANLDNLTAVTDSYDKNNRFIDNYIDDVSRGGIWIGYQENPVISRNRITRVSGIPGSGLITFGIGMGEKNITPNVMNGIKLSPNNYNVTIEKNEISDVSSDNHAYGMLITEPGDVLTFYNRNYNTLEQIRVRYNEPNYPLNLSQATTQKYTVSNNIVRDIMSINNENYTTSRTGIAFSPSTELLGADENYIKRVLISNNTIVIADEDVALSQAVHDGLNYSGKSVSGITVMDVENFEIFNNAIYIKTDARAPYDYMSAITLRSMNPKLIKDKINIDHNAYYLRDSMVYGYTPQPDRQPNDEISYVRFFELDKQGRLLDNGGFKTEYTSFRN